VIDVKTFSRDGGDDLSPGVNELVRVFVATKRKIAEGDKLAGATATRAYLEDRPRGGHAVPPRRPARSTSSSTRSACRAG
jgi:DNA-directed RNA polymerase, beta subunit/140 kD subunit